ncbi:alpha/beta fold hydrolase [Curtobacterium sp. ISL-83]|uniref:alpha/beta fold hydrolase n=1 Tax=Curtobacterium sp. ISL-83 TaxID=2819145 RepID=UPI001BE702F5|nr:alpha/beta hydrolase [Curtobacterium sp. ISL-83]MBT2502105.1 alpha/beta hydrolase [Curtobacterium sp. ISL-83]
MTNPTVVFVHGALVRDGAWWWQPTADLLRTRTGIESRALALPSCGKPEQPERPDRPDQPAAAPAAPGSPDLRTDAAALRRALDGLSSVILVGHSYGGTVIAEAGAHPAVTNLLLVSSYTPAVGQAQAAIMSGEPDPVAVAVHEDGTVSLDGYDETSFGARFLQDADPATQRAAWHRTTSQSVAALGTPTTNAGWADVDSTAMVCLDDRSTTVALQREHAARASRSVEVPTGHHPFITRPDLVVDQIRAFLA